MLKNKSITTSLIITIVTTVVFLVGALLGYEYWLSRKIVMNEIRKNATNLIKGTASEIRATLKAVETVTETIAHLLEDTGNHYDTAYLEQLVSSVVTNNLLISGFTTAFEPYAFDTKDYYFSPYTYRTPSGDIENDFEHYEKYPYFYRDWYQIPHELEKPVWSEPYYDSGEGGGNFLMSTYSLPFYKVVDGKKTLIGIVAADLALDALSTLVSSIKIGETGYSFLISSTGKIVTHPRKEWVMNETIFSIAKEFDDNALWNLGKNMIQGKKAFVPWKDPTTGKNGWLAYTPLESVGWSLGIFFPEDELMSDVMTLTKRMALIALIGFIIIIFFVVVISRAITMPIRDLVEKTKEIAQGNLDMDLKKTDTHNEVGMLANAFISMSDSLKKYIAELTQTTAAKEHIESELHIAHEIQMSMIPKLFPAFPEREELDIYATLHSAKEVGGDLYNFFMLDKDLLCFVIGDVSGKGVPASLFMAVSNTLIETMAREVGPHPDKILKKVNEQICKGNDSCMFVTTFLCIFDIKTGILSYANGGHNPPIVLPQGKSPYFLSLMRGTSIGIDPDAHYQNGTLSMNQGDKLYLYTDGVTEAFNTKGEEYSEARLLTTLQTLCSEKHRVKEIIEGILTSVKTFAGEEPQSDDITMFMIEYRVPPVA